MIYANLIQMRNTCPMCTWMMGPWGWLFMLLVGILLLAVVGGLGWLIYRFIVRSSVPDEAGRQS